MEAGFLQLIPTEVPTGRSQIPLHTAIVNNRAIFSTIPNDKRGETTQLPNGEILHRKARFDLTELYEKHKNTVWATSIQLERLSICDLGVKNFIRGGKLVGRGYPEVHSVSLPGTAHFGQDNDMAEITYATSKPMKGVKPNTIFDVSAR